MNKCVRTITMKEMMRRAECFDDLLAALRELLDEVSDIRGVDVEEYKPAAFATARAAIARATGVGA